MEICRIKIFGVCFFSSFVVWYLPSMMMVFVILWGQTNGSVAWQEEKIGGKSKREKKKNGTIVSSNHKCQNSRKSQLLTLIRQSNYHIVWAKIITCWEYHLWQWPEKVGASGTFSFYFFFSLCWCCCWSTFFIGHFTFACWLYDYSLFFHEPLELAYCVNVCVSVLCNAQQKTEKIKITPFNEIDLKCWKEANDSLCNTTKKAYIHLCLLCFFLKIAPEDFANRARESEKKIASEWKISTDRRTL